MVQILADELAGGLQEIEQVGADQVGGQLEVVPAGGVS